MKLRAVPESAKLQVQGKALRTALREYINEIREIEVEQPYASPAEKGLLSARAEIVFAYEHVEKAIEHLKKLEPEEASVGS